MNISTYFLLNQVFHVNLTAHPGENPIPPNTLWPPYSSLSISLPPSLSLPLPLNRASLHNQNEWGKISEQAYTFEKLAVPGAYTPHTAPCWWLLTRGCSFKRGTRVSLNSQTQIWGYKWIKSGILSAQNSQVASGASLSHSHKHTHTRTNVHIHREKEREREKKDRLIPDTWLANLQKRNQLTHTDTSYTDSYIHISPYAHVYTYAHVYMVRFKEREKKKCNVLTCLRNTTFG